MHDLFKLRSLTSVFANDAFDMLRDHQDALSRLSRPVPPDPAVVPDMPSLSRAGEKLLQLAVANPRKKYEQAAQAFSCPAQQSLKTFLQHARVLDSPIWKHIFGAVPPRRTLQRLAMTCGAKIHPNNQSHGYQREQDFEQEVRRILRWYKPGRKDYRVKRGIRRGPRDGPFKIGRRTAVTTRVNRHFKTLLAQRLPALYRWRHAAMALIEAESFLKEIGTERWSLCKIAWQFM